MRVADERGGHCPEHRDANGYSWSRVRLISAVTARVTMGAHEHSRTPTDTSAKVGERESNHAGDTREDDPIDEVRLRHGWSRLGAREGNRRRLARSVAQGARVARPA